MNPVAGDADACAANITQFHVLWARYGLEPRLDKCPPAHILRLFLRPDDLGRIRIGREDLGEPCSRERIKLFEPDDGNIGYRAFLFAGRLEIVIDLAAAKDDPS